MSKIASEINYLNVDYDRNMCLISYYCLFQPIVNMGRESKKEEPKPQVDILHQFNPIFCYINNGLTVPSATNNKCLAFP